MPTSKDPNRSATPTDETTPLSPHKRAAWFRSVVQTHEVLLVRYTTNVVRGDVEKAREIVQETFLRLWKSDTHRAPQHLRAWLLTVCRNQALDVLRREDRMQPTHEVDQRPSTTPGPHAVIEKQQTLSNVFAALENLPEKKREVIRLKFQEGLSYKEISRITGHSVSYVGVLIHEGMKTLRSLMQAAPKTRLDDPTSSPLTSTSTQRVLQ